MAPALTLPPREPPDCDPTAPDADKQAHRPILAPVDNLANHMENNAMGVQDQPGQAKETPGLGSIFGDLTQMSNNELFDAMKNIENSGDPLAAVEPEAIFPLDLPEPVEPEGDSSEDKIKQAQVHIERRCDFLTRRLRILQARAIGKRISEEVAQVFEKSTRGARKDGGGRPMGLKALLKRVETTAALQASAASRNTVGPKYYNAGSSRGDASRSASVGISSGTLAGLEDTAGALRSHLSMVKHELDSDATASSSGAESNDEAVTYNNPHQQPMPIEKRALWTWQRERASIASRWGWLQAQVQELEYKIRQHSDLHAQVREAKGPVEFEGQPPQPDPPVGYEGALPGSDTDDEPASMTCARIRPLRRETFKKRKLLQMHNLHIATNKAAKPSDIRCSCTYGVESCPVCTGRDSGAQPAPLLGTLCAQQRLALVDPGYHPVLSDIKDVSPWTHMAALCSRGWFRARGARASRGAHHSTHNATPHATHAATQHATPRGAVRQSQPAQPLPKPAKKHKLKRGRPPLSRKIREREREEEAQERGRCRASTESRGWRRASYDIDNIVIPASVAANTRPQILTYKEIITPKWRVNEIPEVPLNNGISKSNRMSMDESDEEDVSERAVSRRHVRAECRERERYVRKQRVRRSQHEPGADPLCAVSALPALPALPPQESVKPYSPRQFPLPDDAYFEMLSVMPEGYRPSSSEQSPLLDDNLDVIDDDSSTLSPLSLSVYEGDDPDDIEWDPSVEKSDKKKNSFR